MKTPWLTIFLILISLSGCSKLKDSFFPQKGLIVTPAGNIFRTKEAWQQNVKDYNPKYRALHARAIGSTQDWKNYILAIFPEAQENPPSSIKPFPWPMNPSVFALYGDFLKTGKPTAVFVETMPGLPTVRTLIVSQWDNDRWNELLRLDENGVKTPYITFKRWTLSHRPSWKFAGYSIRLQNSDQDKNKSFDFLPCLVTLDFPGCLSIEKVYWSAKNHRFFFIDMADRIIFDQKDFDEKF
ncbi:MAG: hypothetical protein HY401_06615 [Elusimicrobia bacterium]|nr:hypothetical protein [Elusimicrobiota bacterium]